MRASPSNTLLTLDCAGSLAARRYRWFRPMMEAIATELMIKVAYGVQVRAGIGASLSFLDMVSDSYMIRNFFMTGRSGASYALVGMVCGNVAFQLLIVTMQTAGLTNNKWRTVFFEVLSVVTFSKPGVDAYRLASGAEQQPGALVNPLIESIATKMGEVVFEAVPGLTIQLVAFLQAEEKTTAAVISLLVSVGSTAMIATVMFYDQETDPGTRKRNPKWLASASEACPDTSLLLTRRSRAGLASSLTRHVDWRSRPSCSCAHCRLPPRCARRPSWRLPTASGSFTTSLGTTLSTSSTASRDGTSSYSIPLQPLRWPTHRPRLSSSSTRSSPISRAV